MLFVIFESRKRFSVLNKAISKLRNFFTNVEISSVFDRDLGSAGDIGDGDGTKEPPADPQLPQKLVILGVPLKALASTPEVPNLR